MIPLYCMWMLGGWFYMDGEALEGAFFGEIEGSFSASDHKHGTGRCNHGVRLVRTGTRGTAPTGAPKTTILIIIGRKTVGASLNQNVVG